MHALCFLSQQVYKTIFEPNHADFSYSTSHSKSIFEEVIEITERPFGIRLTTGPETIIIKEVILNSLASKLGLLAGDKLIKINDINTDTLEPKVAMRLFRTAKLPFNVTFEKSVINFVAGHPQTETGSSSSSPISPLSDPPTSPPKMNQNRFSYDDLKSIGITNTDNTHHLNVSDEIDIDNFSPYSPKFSDTEQGHGQYGNVINSNAKNDESKYSHNVSEFKEDGDINGDGVDSETDCDSDCSFSFGSLNFGDDPSLHSSSLETPIPCSPHLTGTKNKDLLHVKETDNVQLLKDLLSDSEKQRRLEVLHSNNADSQDMVDNIESILDECNLTDFEMNVSEENQSVSTKRFIKHYLWMDTQNIFDEYLCQPLEEEEDTSDCERQQCTLRLKLDEMSQCMQLNQVSAVSDNGYDENTIIVLKSSDGLSKGYHEWRLKILQCDIYRQEIGVIGIQDIAEQKIDVNGIKDTIAFGARSIYGNELLTNSLYYASYNKDGKPRCCRDLSDNSKIGWCTGDIITVCLDLEKWKVKYYLNDVKVRKTMSLERNQTYYPIIAFSGHCRYELLEFQ